MSLSTALDPIEHLVEGRRLRYERQLRREELLKRLPRPLCASHQGFVDFRRNVAHLHVRHACILHARVESGHRRTIPSGIERTGWHHRRVDDDSRLDERIEPAFGLGERAMLEGWLDFHRDTLRWKCAGLDAAQLRTRSVPPSSMSLIGLVRHLTDVERTWFRRVLAGEDAPAIHWTDDHPEGDFELVDDADPAEALSAWEAEVAAARAITAAQGLDDTGLRHGEPCTLRWILVHMIEEYARHNCHGDLLRERIDGTTGD
jgi:uncharacterized damage-inducible protein DinB